MFAEVERTLKAAQPDEYLIDLIDEYGRAATAHGAAKDAYVAAVSEAVSSYPAVPDDLIDVHEVADPHVGVVWAIDAYNDWDHNPVGHSARLAALKNYSASCSLVETQYDVPQLKIEEDCYAVEMVTLLRAIGATEAMSTYGVRRKLRLAAVEPALITSVISDLERMAGV